MAKEQKGITINNAEIDFEEGKIIETHKDGVRVFSIDGILEEWHGIEGISLKISLNREIVPDETEY